MKRTTRPPGTRRHALLGAVVLVAAVTSSSVAAADAGPGPLGVTVHSAVTRQTARVGALFHGSGGHFCTASVVHSAGRDLIVTAAHCVDGGGTLRFAPGYRDGKAPYGYWEVQGTFVPEGWTSDQDEDTDVAFAVLADKDGHGVEDVVGGGNVFASGRATGSTAVTVTGYPSTLDTAITCTNKPTVHSSTQQRIGCPGFAGGTSGSPWVNGDGEVVGVIGGHQQGGDTDDVSFSVVFKTEVAELYHQAVTTSTASTASTARSTNRSTN
ncbi:trypsin-like serine peptidase [Streptomyces sp. NPDC058252]|uniref:trypsin-like serine peptidase n=1 Tax=Streptomyces sp. NPDC058252 TaxID=3346405 RepID=UPI0036E3ED4F